MITKYGFKVDEIAKYEVSRVCSVKKFGEILGIETKKEIMEIRITPSGFIKIYRHKKIKMTQSNKKIRK